MSAFDAGGIVSGLTFDVSQFTGGMSQVIAAAGQFPAVVQANLDAPLLAVERQFNRDIHGRFVAGLGRVAEASHGAAGGIEHLDHSSAFFAVAGGELAAHAFEHMLEGARKLVEFLPELIGEVANTALELSLLAEKSGVGIEFFSGWVEVGKRVNVAQDQISQGFKFLQRNAAEATEGNKEAMAAFRELGIGSHFLKENLGDVEALFTKVHEKMQLIPNQAQRVLAGMKVLGRGGSDLTPLFNMPTQQVEEMIANAKRLGSVETEEAGKRARVWKDLQVRVGESFEGMRKKISEPFQEAFIAHWKEIQPLVESVANAIAHNLGDSIEGISVVITGSLKGIEAYGHLFQWLGQQLEPGVTDALMDVGAAMTTIAGAILIIIDTFASFANYMTQGAIQPLDDFIVKLRSAHDELGRLHDAMQNQLSYQQPARDTDFSGGSSGGDFGPQTPVKVDVHVRGSSEEIADRVAQKVKKQTKEHYDSLQEKLVAAGARQKIKGGIAGRGGR